MKQVCVALPRDLRDAGLPDAQICLLAYNKAVETGCEEIRVHDPSGRSRVYTRQDIATYLSKFPIYRSVMNVRLPQREDPYYAFRYRNTLMRPTRSGLFAPAT